MIPTPYDTMTDALNDLKQQGFTYDFNLITPKEYRLATHLRIRDFKIVQTFRFENNSDPSESAVLYTIVSEKHHIKGTLVNGFGIYSDASTDRFIRAFKS